MANDENEYEVVHSRRRGAVTRVLDRMIDTFEGAIAWALGFSLLLLIITGTLRLVLLMKGR